MAEKKEELSISEMKTEVAPINTDEVFDLSIGDMPTMDEEGFQPLGDVDRYQIVRELGAGGFGTVFLAKDTVAGTQVALKSLPPEISTIPEELENVRSNFVLISKLVHQNIAGLLHLHKVEEADTAAKKLLHISPSSYLVIMEYISGSTLSVWKKQFDDRKMPIKQAIDICEKVAAALDFAHENNIIHRDVKPSNIMITTDEKVKVMDFGLAAEVRSSMTRVSQEKFDSSGTRPYMAPEQWSGDEQGIGTDQYALAVMFYELISGKVPFHSVFETGDATLMMNVVEKKQPKPLPELDKKQNTVLLRALSKKPEERFASCGDFIKAISGNEAKSNASRWFMAIILIVLIAGAVYFVLNNYNKKSKSEVKVPTKLPKTKITSQINELPAIIAPKKKISDIRKKLKKVPHDFNIKINTASMKRSFRAGEKIAFKIEAEKDCHIAVFCHQNDGSTVLLFPNIWNRNTFIKAGQTIDIPGKVRKNFEIEAGPPFGSDIVQIIACTRKNTFHSKMDTLVKAESNGYCGLSRGLFSKSVTDSINNTSPNASLKWGEAKITITTHEK